MRRLAVLLCAVSLPASAYNEAIHALLTRHAFADRAAWLAEPLAPPTQADLDAFRALFWRTAAHLPDPALRAKFLARWPSEQAFTAWELKQLFLLDPAARVHGFDLVDAGRMARGDLLAAASRWPDDDERNRYRYLRGSDHGIVRAPDGSPVPYDPATLDLGSLTGTTSQGHAHYGLVTEPLSDDPAVLKKEPWRFAVPPTAHAYGAELAQLYTNLSLLAAGALRHRRPPRHRRGDDGRAGADQVARGAGRHPPGRGRDDRPGRGQDRRRVRPAPVALRVRAHQ